MPTAPPLPWLSTTAPTPGRRMPGRRRLIPTRRLRRIGAALLVAVAVWCAVTAVRPGPPPHQVITAVTDLAADHVLTAADLGTARVDDRLLPVGAVPEVRLAVGRRLAGPVSAREIIVETDLGADHALSTTERALHVPIADPGAVMLLHPGDHVDLLEAGAGKVVAGGVRVLSVDDPNAEKGGHGVVVAIGEGQLAALVPAMSANGPGIAPALRKQ